MKRKLLHLVLATTIASQSLFAYEPIMDLNPDGGINYIYNGGGEYGNARTKIENFPNEGHLVLNSQTGIFYSIGNIVAKNIIVVNEDSKGDANVADAITYHGGPTIDINTYEGEVTALYAALWQQNLLKLTIRNSCYGSRATAIVDVDRFNIINPVNHYSELKFDSVNAKVNATANFGFPTSTENNKGKVTFTITETANVIWNGDILLNQHSNLNLAGNLRHKNTITMKDGSTANISGTLESEGDIILNSGANVDVSGKINLRENSNLTVNEGAKLNMTSNSISLMGGSLTLNTENALANESGEVAALVAATDAMGSSVNVNADQNFSTIDVIGSTMSIYLADNVGLHVDTITGSADGKIQIYNFAENSVSVSSNGWDKNEVSIALFDGAGNFLGTAILNNAGYLTAAIPEPAEWATIFGALALGFAVYRRRK